MHVPAVLIAVPVQLSQVLHLLSPSPFRVMRWCMGPHELLHLPIVDRPGVAGAVL